MRLLHTTDLRLQEFFDAQIPNYAILSHRWEEDEVSYQDWLDGKKQSGKGYHKIIACCRVAAEAGHDWVWIDTCCIDRKSSAELSEAINSMFIWYRKSKVCFAYLSDVPDISETSGISEHLAYFRSSLWFTRGWTLQELLAPRNLIFLNKIWRPVRSESQDDGHRNSLFRDISATTGIEIGSILNFVPENERAQTPMWTAPPSTAMIMSWAAKRETSRTEDKSYCLLGLFSINMALLYGEGNAAFKRLQMEIIAKSTDETIFVWDFPDAISPYKSSMLASSPAAFADAYNTWEDHSTPFRGHYSVTNRGLLMRVLTFQLDEDIYENGKYMKRFCFALRCRKGLGEIPLVPILESPRTEQHPKVHPNTEDLEVLYSRDGREILWRSMHELTTMARVQGMTLTANPVEELSPREFGYRLWAEHSRMIYLKI